VRRCVCRCSTCVRALYLHKRVTISEKHALKLPTTNSLQKSALSRKRVIIQSEQREHKHGTLAQTHGRSQSRSGPEAHFKKLRRCIKSGGSRSPDTVEIQMSTQMCCLWLFDSLLRGLSLSFNDVKRERAREGGSKVKQEEKLVCVCVHVAQR
jgi:hypothetical protein